MLRIATAALAVASLAAAAQAVPVKAAVGAQDYVLSRKSRG